MRFVRPINWIVAILDGKVLPFATVDGMESGNITQGHRFMARGPFKVTDSASYLKAMEEGKVILSSKKRKRLLSPG